MRFLIRVPIACLFAVIAACADQYPTIQQKPTNQLVSELNSSSTDTRRNAAMSLEKALRKNPTSQEVQAGLKAALRDDDCVVQAWAALGLSNVHSPPVETLLSTAEALLASKSGWCRIQGAVIVGRLGSKSSSGVGILIAAATDPDPHVRKEVALSLGTIADPTDKASTTLVGLLADNDSSVKLNALKALVHYPEAKHRAAPSIAAFLDDPDDLHRAAAIEALAEMGAAEYVSGIVRLLRDERPFVRLRATRAIGQLPMNVTSRVDELAQLLDDDDLSVKREAVRLLGTQGKVANNVIDRLILLMDDPQVAATAIEAIVLVDGQNPKVQEALKKALAKAMKMNDRELINRISEALDKSDDP